MRELSELSGYSEAAIYWFEHGLTPPMRNAKSGRAKDRKQKPWVLHRYHLVCAAVDHQKKTGESFDWS